MGTNSLILYPFRSLSFQYLFKVVHYMVSQKFVILIFLGLKLSIKIHANNEKECYLIGNKRDISLSVNERVVLTWAIYNMSLLLIIIMLVSLVGSGLHRVFKRKHYCFFKAALLY